MGCSPPGSLVHGDSPGKNIGLGCHALLQGIFPTQGSNTDLLHCRWILYHLSYQGSPRILEWVVYPFSRGTSKPRNWIGCIAGGFLTSWTTRKAYYMSYLGEIISIQFSSDAQSCLTLCDPVNCSTQGLPVHHQLPEFTQTLVHQVNDAIQPSHPLSSPSPPAPNPSHRQSLFQWVNSLHEVAKVLKFQL